MLPVAVTKVPVLIASVVPGAVVARVNMSSRFMRELIDAMNDAWSKWSSREGIRNLPETQQDER